MNMKYFHAKYNGEIYKDLQSDKNLVICSSLGSGKSTTVKKYIYDNPDKKILLIVNKIEDMQSFQQDLPDNLIYVDKNSRIKLKESINIVMGNSEYNALAITKVRFNYMITVHTKMFDNFHKIIIDESAGLNPIIQEDFDTEIRFILDTMAKTLRCLEKDAMDDLKEMMDFLYKINDDIISKDGTSKMTRIQVPKKYRILSVKIKKYLFKMYEADKINEHSIVNILGLLNNIEKNKMYISEYNTKSGKKSNVLYCNDFFKTYIENSKVSIKVLDGTATFIKELYEWLDFEIKDNYIDDKKSYPNLKFHVYNFDDITPFKGRNDKELQGKMLKFIKREEIPEDYLLFTNKSSVETFGEGYKKVDYAFSGRDVGSNIYKDEKNMVVVFWNTLPQSYRILYNKDIKGMSDFEAQSQLNLEVAEHDLVGSMLAQLVGRTAIREDCNTEVNIYFFCVSWANVYGAIRYFGLKRGNVNVYNASLNLRKKVKLNASGIIHILKDKMKYGDEIIDVRDEIKLYYGKRFRKNTTSDFRKKYIETVKQITKDFGYRHSFKDGKYWRLLKK